MFREERLAWLRQALEAGRVVPGVCAETVAELRRVLAYLKLKLSEDETKNVLAHYMEHAEATATLVSRTTRRGRTTSASSPTAPRLRSPSQ